MPRVLCYFGIAIAVVLLGMFGLDLAGIHLGGGNKLADVAFIVCAGILGYLSWTTLREQK
jgi:hypothetical protein